MALIEFFDGDDDTRSYATAIKAVLGEGLALALLVKFLQGKDPNAECVSTQCTTGHAQGHRLDGWVKAAADGGLMTLYQVEVKLWAQHSLLNAGVQPQDAHPLVQPPDNAPADVHRAYNVQQRWYQYWDDHGFRYE